MIYKIIEYTGHSEMTRPRTIKRAIALTLLCGLLTVNTGCIAAGLGYGLSFGAGWLAGLLTAPTTTETICFRNGVQIDCSELPEFE